MENEFPEVGLRSQRPFAFMLLINILPNCPPSEGNRSTHKALCMRRLAKAGMH